jgi:hypothetical protein
MAQGDVSVLEREVSLDRREVRTLRQYLAAIGDEIEIAALSSLGHRIVIVGAHTQAPLRVVPGQRQSDTGQPQIETAFADAMTKAAEDGSLAAWWFTPKSRRRKTEKSAPPKITFLRLHDAVKEAHQAQGIYGDARSRMLATVLRAVERAVYSEDPKLKALTKLHELAAKLLGEEPMKFGPAQWNEFEAWLLAQTRAAIAAGIRLPELASGVRVAIISRAPNGAVHDEQILRAWEKVAKRRHCIDAQGRVLNDEAVIKDLLTEAFRASGIDAGTRKDPFRYVKDKLELRVPHKRRSGKRS